MTSKLKHKLKENKWIIIIMNKIIITTILLFLAFYICSCKENITSNNSILETNIDSLLSLETRKPFNGIILIEKDGKKRYSKIQGFSDLEKRIPLKMTDQFIIGSVSKQFTAIIILQEYDRGRLDLHIPIKKYLQELSESWADTVTIHHLLTHTHGIVTLDKPTMFPIGTQYNYSQIGYDLLAKISEKTSGKSFVELSTQLFKECGMNNTFHPETKIYKNLVKGYIEDNTEKLECTDKALTIYPAAGSFISTANDLILWNNLLFEGKLLKESTFHLMTSIQDKAVRNHPIFGITKYGYGITVDNKNEIIRWGQTGLAPGFVSMNFYFPQNKESVIVLSNVDYEISGLIEAFYYHTQILDIVKKENNLP